MSSVQSNGSKLWGYNLSITSIETVGKNERKNHDCRGHSLVRNRRPLGPNSKTMPRALWGS